MNKKVNIVKDINLNKVRSALKNVRQKTIKQERGN